MSPTILVHGRYRFFFNSREEARMHVHVSTGDGVAKFWLEPIVSMADYHNVTPRQLKDMARIVEERQNDFKGAWKKHFKG